MSISDRVRNKVTVAKFDKKCKCVILDNIVVFEDKKYNTDELKGKELFIIDDNDKICCAKINGNIDWSFFVSKKDIATADNGEPACITDGITYKYSIQMREGKSWME